MKANKNDDQFKTGFQQLITGWQKNDINVPTLHDFDITH